MEPHIKILSPSPQPPPPNLLLPVLKDNKQKQRLYNPVSSNPMICFTFQKDQKAKKKKISHDLPWNTNFKNPGQNIHTSH